MKSIRGIVAGVTPLTKRITEFRLVPAEGESFPTFTPGSHIRVHVAQGDSRAYSLIRFNAAQDGDDYRIAVQREPDGEGGSKFMHELTTGDDLTFEPPKNDFPLDPDAPALLLAGGIGVTPMISMAAALSESGRDFAFHYAGRSVGVMAHIDQLRDRLGDNLHLHFDEMPECALDLDALLAGIEPDRHLYVCGPRGMIEAAKSKAEALGISPQRIHFELFENPVASADDTAFEVELASSGQVIVVQPGQSIIEALEADGVDVIYDCQRGDCGICQCDVISGIPDHRDVVLSDAERASGKVMQICVSRAKSDRLVLDI